MQFGLVAENPLVWIVQKGFHAGNGFGFAMAKLAIFEVDEGLGCFEGSGCYRVGAGKCKCIQQCFFGGVGGVSYIKNEVVHVFETGRDMAQEGVFGDVASVYLLRENKDEAIAGAKDGESAIPNLEGIFLGWWREAYVEALEPISFGFVPTGKEMGLFGVNEIPPNEVIGSIQ